VAGTLRYLEELHFFGRNYELKSKVNKKGKEKSNIKTF
jgi:hypothetical protein